MSKRARDAASATDASSKRSRRGDDSKATAAMQNGVTTVKRRGRAAASAPADDSADTAVAPAASSSLIAPAAEPAAAADADAEFLDPRLAHCIPFDGYTHLLQAYLGPHCLCMLLDRPPEVALGEDALQTSEDPHRSKVLAPIVLRFVDQYLQECLPPAGFFSKPTTHSSENDRRRKQLNAVQHCIHAILFNAPLSLESPVAFHDVVVYPARRELPTAADGSADFNLLYSNLAQELGATFLETHAIVSEAAAAPAAAASVASKKKKGSARSAAAAASAAAASSVPARVGVYYQFFVQIRPAGSPALDHAQQASAAQEERMDLAVAPASPPPRRRRERSRSSRKDATATAAASKSRSRSRAPPPPPSKRSLRALHDSAALLAVRELESRTANAPVDLSTLAAVVAIGPHDPRSQHKIYPAEKPAQVLKRVVLRKKKVKTEEGQ